MFLGPEQFWIELKQNEIVIAGLVPAIHELDSEEHSQPLRSWMAGIKPAMTDNFVPKQFYTGETR